MVDWCFYFENVSHDPIFCTGRMSRKNEGKVVNGEIFENYVYLYKKNICNLRNYIAEKVLEIFGPSMKIPVDLEIFEFSGKPRARDTRENKIILVRYSSPSGGRSRNVRQGLKICRHDWAVTDFAFVTKHERLVLLATYKLREGTERRSSYHTSTRSY